MEYYKTEKQLFKALDEANKENIINSFSILPKDDNNNINNANSEISLTKITPVNAETVLVINNTEVVQQAKKLSGSKQKVIEASFTFTKYLYYFRCTKEISNISASTLSLMRFVITPIYLLSGGYETRKLSKTTTGTIWIHLSN
jgi:hypothetical protein